MRLYEHEGKSLLAQAGILVPQQLTLQPLSDLTPPETFPAILKAQVLHGNRAHQGLIKIVKSESEWQEVIDSWKSTLEPTTVILQETVVSFDQEFYLTLRYDTRPRRPVLMFSATGGTGIEERGESLKMLPLEIGTLLPEIHPSISQAWLEQLFQTFLDRDCTLIEINPLIITENGPMALDAKIELDDTAVFRHPEWAELYPPRTLFARQPTQREQAAKHVNAADHRGIAGASYFEFDGTIGVLASGGGASQLAMDALLASGLKPANYTEYSGNPPREKVAELTKVVMSHDNLEGLWVVGGHANFTDIYETLMGVIDGVEAMHPPTGFPIIIRRGGPRLEEAFVAVQKRAEELKLTVKLYDSSFPITDTVGVLQNAVHIFREESHVYSAA
jgi:succinyl-CoA synthetase beta subunit